MTVVCILSGMSAGEPTGQPESATATPTTYRGPVQTARYAFVIVDNATRYPEGVPLRSISAKSVAQVLFQLIFRVGIPKEILTEQGT
ncbi:hypothetical protein NHX12_017968 [Muraenolepis orangiensis]|uniref:Integrase catalytic domain-containing protein n=1 Tax=Muraenolepis orangiensis TaxID=630683 RepID=A0A9Q0IX54_9TELE|nr:hypothetical protein NHX12_017968 [Muraenolepis orangiensis]